MLIRVGSRRIARNRSLGGYLASTEQIAKAAYIQNSSSDLVASGAIVGDSLTPELNIGDKVIVSADFVSGLSGWRIAGTGEAEFQSVDVRGNISAASGQIGNWNISGAAASRGFGDKTLFGTYLESSIDIGDNDLNVTTGTYVGLFKSFIPESINIITVAVASTVVTLTTAEEHPYEVGDQIVVTLLGGSASITNNNGNPVTITARTSTTIIYTGPIAATIASQAVVGSVIRYVEDVAGLYLRDYGKREFDYGYFSNKGVAYNSAAVLNLVHNPSFESTYFEANEVTTAFNITTLVANGATDLATVTAIGHSLVAGDEVIVLFDNALYTAWEGPGPSGIGETGTVTSITSTTVTYTLPISGGGATVSPQVNTTGTIQKVGATGVNDIVTNFVSSGWTYNNAAITTSYDLTSSTLYDNNSAYAAVNSWNTASQDSKYWTATVDYGAGSDFFLWTEDRPIYVKADIYFNQTLLAISVTNLVVNNTTTMTVTTSTTHGFAAGDLVYLDFSAIDTALNDFTKDGAFYGASPRTFKVLTTPLTTTFTIRNTLGVASSGTVTRTAAVNDDGTSRAVSAYRTFQPTIYLQQARIKFSNGSSDLMVNAMSSSAYATFSNGNNGYAYQNPSNFMDRALNGNKTVVPITMPSIVLDGDLVNTMYSSLDSAGYAAKSDFYLQIPGWFYDQNNGTYSAGPGWTWSYSTVTELVGESNIAVSMIVDNVSMSTKNKFFFENYYNPDTNVLVSTEQPTPTGYPGAPWQPNYPSYVDGNTWLNVDLDTQTFTSENMTLITFDSPEIGRAMLSTPYIAPYESWKYPAAVESQYYGVYDLVAGSGSFGSTDQTLTVSGGVFSQPRLVGSIDFTSDAQYIVGDRGASQKLQASRAFLDQYGRPTTALSSGIDFDTYEVTSSYKTATTIYSHFSTSSTEVRKRAYIQLEAEAPASVGIDGTISSIVLNANTVDISGTNTYTTGLTASTGWTLGAYSYKRVGGIVSASAVATRTGGTLSPAAAGTLADSAVFTFPAGFTPSYQNGSVSNGGTLGSNFSGYVTTGGVATITSLEASATFANNSAYTFSVMFVL
jgi:hypothetical protein